MLLTSSNKQYIRIVTYFVAILCFVLTENSAKAQTPVISSVNVNSCVGSITISVTSGVAPYTYVWRDDLGNILPFTSFVASGLTAGDYSVEVTDANLNSTGVATYTVTNPPDLVGSVVVNDVSCKGDSDAQVVITMSNGNPGYDWELFNGGGASIRTGSVAFPSNVITISGLGIGNYTITLTDQDGCTGDINFSITEPADFLGLNIASSTDATCYNSADGTITANGTGGWGNYTFQWVRQSDGVIVGTTATVTGLIPGDYRLNLTDRSGTGCTVSSGNVTISSPPQILATDVISQVQCNGGNDGAIDVSVSGGVAPYSYSWSNGATSEDLVGLTSGAYALTVTDNSGCTAVFNFNVTEPVVLSSTPIVTDVNCFGGSDGRIVANVTGGTAPYSYSWSNGQNTQSATNLSSGLYNLTVTDANGCMVTVNNISVGQPASALALNSSTLNEPSCFGGSDGSINTTFNGGTGPYSYLWSNGQTTSTTTGLTSGFYSVTVTDANGCQITENFTLNDPVRINVAPTLTMPTCNGAADGSITVVASNGTGPYTYNWSTGGSGATVNGLVAGNYSVTVTDAGGCSVVENYVLGEPSVLVDNATVNNVSCSGANDGSVFLGVTGGTAPYTYSWSNGATTANISGLSPATYSVTITDANGCSIIENYTIIDPAPIGVTFTQVDVACRGASTGSIDIFVTGGTAPYTYLWSNGATSEDLINVTAGNYSVTVRDASNCNTVLNVTITEPATVLTLSGAETDVSCNGGSNGSIDLTVTGGNGPYSYSWNTGANTEDISSLSAGTYSVTVTDANGCIKSLGFNITEPLPLLINPTENDITCNGANDGEILSAPSGGTAPYTYTWADDGSITVGNRSGLSAGNYTLTVTDANGCQNSQVFTIDEPSTLTATALTVDVSCFGEVTGGIDLTPTGGVAPYTFLWSNGVLTEDLSGIAAGNYSVQVKDANGCVINENFTINQPSAVLAITEVVSQITCNGNLDGAIDISVTGGTAPYSFNWSNGASTEDLTNLAAANYSLTVTDANGCTVVGAYNITNPPLLSVSENITDVSCFGAGDGSINLTVSGGEAPYTFNWSNGANTEDVNGLAPGNFSVTIIDARGCAINGAYTVSSPAQLQVTGITTDVSCFGNSTGEIDINVTGGTAPYAYSWSSGENSEDINGLIAGSYQIIVTDANGCSETETFLIQQPSAALAANGVVTDISCFGNSDGNIILNTSGGTAPYSYNWNTGSTSQNLTNLGVGSYQVTITDNEGCTFQENYTITMPSALQASSVVTNVLCNGDGTGAIDLTISGGVSPYIINWSNGNSSEDMADLTAGSYTVGITDANGCFISQTISVDEPLPLVINEQIKDVTCFGETDGSIELFVSGGAAPYTYSWSNGSADENISNLDGGVYSIAVTDNNGCTRTKDITVKAPLSSLGATANIQDANCFNQPSGLIELTTTGGTAPYTYQWSNGSNSRDLINVFAGDYSVVITDANGCRFEDLYTIGQPNEINIAFDVTNSTCLGDEDGSVVPTVSGGVEPYSYVWSTGATSKDLLNITGGVYNLTVTDVSGCSYTEAIEVGDSRNLNVQVASQDIGCRGESNGSIMLSVTGGSGNYTYAWDDGPSSAARQSLTAGVYRAVVSDASGCATSVNVVIGEPAADLEASINGTNDILCFGDDSGTLNVQVTGGTAPYSYLWSNGSRASSISNINAGNYIVTVTDANNCVVQVNRTITQPTSPIQINTSGKLALDCQGESDGRILLDVSGGSGGYTYLWSNGSTSPLIDDLAVGDYTVRVTDRNGCSVERVFTISEPDKLRIEAANINQSQCYNDRNGAIALDVLGGTAPYTYQWSTGATTKNLIGITSGGYSVLITDANGCQVQGNYTLDDPELFQLTPEVEQVSCIGANDASISLNIEGGVGPLVIQWNTGASSETLTGVSPGEYNVLVTDKLGCTLQSTFSIFDPLPITLDAFVAEASDCNNPQSGMVNLIVSGGTAPYSYRWSNGATTSSISDVLPGTYVVEVTDDNGCSTQGTYTVLQPEPLQIGLSTEPFIDCENRRVGAIVRASVKGGVGQYTYQWSEAGSINNELFITEPGRISIEVFDDRGCFQTQAISVDIPELGLADYNYQAESIDETGDLAANDPVSFFDLSEGEIIDWHWDFGDGFDSDEIDPIHTFDAPGVYTVTLTVTDRTGCETQKSSILEITEGYRIMVPDAFTPNGDGNNDFFRPRLLGLIKARLIIYNTWGEVVFSTDDIETKGWDGYARGKLAENGNYVYKLVGVSFNGFEVETEGIFALIK